MEKPLFGPAAFGHRVSAEMTAKGGVRAAAKEAKVSPATMSRVARGQKPTLESYFRLVLWLTGKKPWQ